MLFRSVGTARAYSSTSFAGYTEGVGTLRSTDHKRPEMHVVTTHTRMRSPADSLAEAQTLPTQKQAGWSGSAQEVNVAAPLLNQAQGVLRTTDIDGATWVVSR